MGRKNKFSAEEKLKYVLRCIEGKDSISHTASMIGIHPESLREWVHNYQSLGIDGLYTNSKNSSYSAALKEMAVKDYLAGTCSLLDLCAKYRIRSKGMLRKWVMKYNSHEELKASGTGGVPIMTNGRKTTYDERVEIVKYCIEHQNNYAETAQKYQVSYQQVYTWTSEYESNGVEALQDRRGKRKDENEMSELENKKKLDDAGMTQSMSRVSRCIDNGPMEAFWGMLKYEMYYLKKFNSYDELEAAVIGYIEYYNNHRYQKRLGCMTPMEYRQYLMNQAA